MRPLSALTFALWGLVPAVGQLAECPTDPSIQGYTSLFDINLDMQSLLTAILDGNTTDPGSYEFVLCPFTIFDGRERLVPLLSGSVFTCGANGRSEDECIIDGGDVQVTLIDDFPGNYSVSLVSFHGITFQNFNVTSFLASASQNATTFFSDIVWKDFNATTVVSQFTNTTTPSSGGMELYIENSLVTNGAAEGIFFNGGGLLDVTGVTVSQVLSFYVINTALDGLSFFSDSIVTLSELDGVTLTSFGGFQSVDNVRVIDNIILFEAFAAYGFQSAAIVINSVISDNFADTGFMGVVATEGASVDVMNSQINDNVGLKFGVAAANSSFAFVSETEFSDNEGDPNDGIKAVAVAFGNSTLLVDQGRFNDNTGFSAIIGSVENSFIEIANTCIEDGEALVAVFVDSSSDYSAAYNFIEDVSVVFCEDPWLFKEDPDYSCFTGPDCFGTCLEVADQAVCGGTTEPGETCDDPIIEFVATVVVEFIGIISQVTDAELRLLEEVFLEAYNQLSAGLHDFCDDLFRQILEVEAQLGSGRRLKQFELEQYRPSLRSLQTGVFLVTFDLNARCAGCGPGTELFIRGDGPTANQFQQALDQGIQDLRDSNMLSSVTGVTDVDQILPDSESSSSEDSSSRKSRSRKGSSSSSSSSSPSEKRSMRRSGRGSRGSSSSSDIPGGLFFTGQTSGKSRGMSSEKAVLFTTPGDGSSSSSSSSSDGMGMMRSRSR